MKIRTISMLPPLSVDDQFPKDSLFEVSQRVGGGYASRNVSYGTLKAHMTDGLMISVASTYGLTADNGDPENLHYVASQVEQMLSGNVTFTGKKVFAQDVYCTADTPAAYLAEQAFTTRAHVKDICRDLGHFMSPNTTYIDANPNNDTPNTTYDENYFVKFQIDQDGRDSSEFILDPYSDMRAGPVYAPATGNMTIYGWLADNGNVAAAEAWVGLFGRVTIGRNGQEKQWVALQIQPWIIGTKSQALQYVGFNVPVKQNMELKIMTGFPVNTRNSGFQDSSKNTLTFINNQPCAFVGYVLRNE